MANVPISQGRSIGAVNAAADRQHRPGGRRRENTHGVLIYRQAGPLADCNGNSAVRNE